MNAQYDRTQWEAATDLGRRLFIYNFSMQGNEFPGWELINTVHNRAPDGTTERIYLWRKKDRAKEELVQVAVTETAFWQHAQQHLQQQLEHCMRPELPPGKGKLKSIGDVQYAGTAEQTERVAALFFSRGNLEFAVRSAGKEPVDITALAKRLDKRLTQAPSDTEQKRGRAKSLSVGKLALKATESAVLLDKLPEPVRRSGWLQVMVPDGELRREGDRLYYSSDRAGSKAVQVFNLDYED